MSPRGPHPVSDRFCSNRVPGLGPPRSAQLEACLATMPSTDGLIATLLPRPLTQRGGVAVSRLDGRGFRSGLRSAFRPPRAEECFRHSLPDPFLGSTRASSAVTDALSRTWVRRFTSRGSLALRCEASRAATLTRIATQAFSAHEFRVASRRLPRSPSFEFDRLSLSRRWPPTSAVPAVDCFARSSLLEKPDSVSGTFSYFAVHFRARRRGEIYASPGKIGRKIHSAAPSYPPEYVKA